MMWNLSRSGRASSLIAWNTTTKRLKTGSADEKRGSEWTVAKKQKKRSHADTAHGSVMFWENHSGRKSVISRPGNFPFQVRSKLSTDMSVEGCAMSMSNISGVSVTA